MTHDERVYTDPHEFRPERYFTDDGQLNDDTDILTFGFGRRYIFSVMLSEGPGVLTKL
jgi:cytochrome P450